MSIKSLFENIADAIKDKNPNVTNVTPAEMPSAIRSIPSGSSTASGVSYDNTSSGLTASNVQDAIDELAGDVSTITSDLSDLTTYSTSETETGKTWIDGKPIYRKVVDLGNLPNTTVKQTAHGISGLSRLTHADIFAYAGDTFLPVPSVNPANLSHGIYANVSTTYVVINTSADWSAYSGYAILEYTKTA